MIENQSFATCPLTLHNWTSFRCNRFRSLNINPQVSVVTTAAAKLMLESVFSLSFALVVSRARIADIVADSLQTAMILCYTFLIWHLIFLCGSMNQV